MKQNNITENFLGARILLRVIKQGRSEEIKSVLIPELWKETSYRKSESEATLYIYKKRSLACVQLNKCLFEWIIGRLSAL